jgi:hypothetical protein
MALPACKEEIGGIDEIMAIRQVPLHERCPYRVRRVTGGIREIPEIRPAPDLHIARISCSPFLHTEN